MNVFGFSLILSLINPVFGARTGPVETLQVQYAAHHDGIAFEVTHEIGRRCKVKRLNSTTIKEEIFAASFCSDIIWKHFGRLKANEPNPNNCLNKKVFTISTKNKRVVRCFDENAPYPKESQAKKMLALFDAISVLAHKSNQGYFVPARVVFNRKPDSLARKVYVKGKGKSLPK